MSLRTTGENEHLAFVLLVQFTLEQTSLEICVKIWREGYKLGIRSVGGIEKQQYVLKKQNKVLYCVR